MFLLNSNVELRTILQPGLLKLLHQDKIASTLEQFSLCTIPCTKKKKVLNSIGNKTAIHNIIGVSQESWTLGADKGC
jgi:hypothetical protein